MMKRLLPILLFLLSATFSFAQNNFQDKKGFSFQGYARDMEGAALSSASIEAKFSIYPEGESEVYGEVHQLTDVVSLWPWGVTPGYVGRTKYLGARPPPLESGP